MTLPGMSGVLRIPIYAADTDFGGLNPGGCDGFRVGCSFQEVSTRRRPRWAIDALMDWAAWR
jgi:hypothetical protein